MKPSTLRKVPSLNYWMPLAEDEEQVGEDDQEAHDKEDAALNDLRDGDQVVAEILRVRLQQGMMTRTILHPQRR